MATLLTLLAAITAGCDDDDTTAATRRPSPEAPAATAALHATSTPGAVSTTPPPAAPSAATPTSTPPATAASPAATAVRTAAAGLQPPPAAAELAALQSKADALLQRAYAVATATPLEAAAIEALAALMDVRSAGGEVVAGVLVATTLSDAELGVLGLTPGARIGAIVAGSIAVRALPALAASPGVTRIEAATRLAR
jgi:hypothetical protein